MNKFINYKEKKHTNLHLHVYSHEPRGLCVCVCVYKRTDIDIHIGAASDKILQICKFPKPSHPKVDEGLLTAHGILYQYIGISPLV